MSARRRAARAAPAAAGARRAHGARRARTSVAASLDGFVAGPNGESGWIVVDPEPDFRAPLAGFDTLLPGRRHHEPARDRRPRGRLVPVRRSRADRRPR